MERYRVDHPVCLGAETFNTALEFFADAMCPHYHLLVGKAKDRAAEAVMPAAMGSLIVGVIIIMG